MTPRIRRRFLKSLSKFGLGREVHILQKIQAEKVFVEAREQVQFRSGARIVFTDLEIDLQCTLLFFRVF